MKTSHPVLRIATVTALSLFFCLTYLPDLARVIGFPYGDWGFHTNGTVVTTVEATSPAQRAGITPGTRIDLSNLPEIVRYATLGGFVLHPGDVASFRIFAQGRW
ncbi:MAG TPA: hypothetical protein VGR69_05825, partial [Candidatus Rubrimentiphilum sp.]|nr:hypothetical protein [Candidatus Rubrimentiphilum sp.]